MKSKSSIVTSAADGCGNPSSIRTMDKSNSSNMEQKGLPIFGYRRGCQYLVINDRICKVLLMGLAGLVLALSPATVPPIAANVALPSGLLVNFESANYNASTGIWTDTSGNGNNASVAMADSYNQLGSNGNPILVANATPNGSPAVEFTFSASAPGTHGQSLGLTNALNDNGGFTIFAYLLPSSAMATINGGFVGGQIGSLEYRLANLHQDLLSEDTADLGTSTTAISDTSWNSINVTVGSTGGSFRLNGVSDGSISGSSFNPIQVIGDGNVNGSEYFAGEIAGLQIYSGELSATDRQTVETYFTDLYVNTVPAPDTLSLVGIGAIGLLLLKQRKVVWRS